MRLLADENIERPIVHWLREQGHDVLWVPESLASATDSQIVEVARVESRVIVTYDLDFGEMLFRERIACDGVILLRCKKLLRQERIAWFQRWWPELQCKALRRLVILRNNGLRVRPFWDKE